IDPASQVLAEALRADKQLSYRALADRSKKTQRQQYLTVEKEKALAEFLLLMSRLGRPVRVKHIPSLAFSLANRRSATNKPIKPPYEKWACAFKRRHPELNAKRVKAIDWKRHENNVYDKIIEWFEVVDNL
ncbi:hypothetical protein EJ04DRAFT_593558, partial [Polyplosphaeria fusca]